MVQADLPIYSELKLTIRLCEAKQAASVSDNFL